MFVDMIRRGHFIHIRRNLNRQILVGEIDDGGGIFHLIQFRSNDRGTEII